jgi:gliding motility-associated-like protein
MLKSLIRKMCRSQSCKVLVTSLLFSFIYLPKIHAQLCQGSLGDPVVNITFGTGSNPGPPLGNLTNYSYANHDCPDDGFYTIGNSTLNCFGGTWHTLQEDHTPGDVNGYMMIINASFNPGDFFVKTVDGLCPNTTYEFASWIYNVLQPFACGGAGILPNITFSIETTTGTVLKSYKTGDISMTGSWVQYGFFFTTTASISSVVIRMTNNAPGGCGNDLLLDDITFRACGPLVTAKINGNQDSVDVCTGNNSSFVLGAKVSAGYNDPVYQWQQSLDSGVSWANISGATDTSYLRPPVITPGIYLYRLAVSQRNNMNISSCSIFSNVITIRVNKFPVPNASTRGSCIGDTLSLRASDGVLFSWQGPSNFNSSDQYPSITNTTPANSGIYFVAVTSAKGCIAFDSTIADLSIKPSVFAGIDTSVCEGQGIQLNAIGNNITSYRWYPALTISNDNIPNPFALPAQTTLYILTVADRGCQISDSLLIVVKKNPRANAGPDKVIIKGQTTILNGTASGTDISFAWLPTDFMAFPDTLTPSVNPPSNKIYSLQVTSNVGCGVATDDVLVKVYEKLFIPNAFTPNNDGLNDTWYIETLQAYPNAEVKVFNRYGQLVFDNHGTNKSWDGTFKGVLLQAGAYAYIIDLKNNTQIVKGVVFIIL